MKGRKTRLPFERADLVRAYVVRVGEMFISDDGFTPYLQFANRMTKKKAETNYWVYDGGEAVPIARVIAEKALGV